jgi:hypothetical protein
MKAGRLCNEAAMLNCMRGNYSLQEPAGFFCMPNVTEKITFCQVSSFC